MEAFYLEIRWVHIAAVTSSGTLFALRGLGRLAGAGWPMAMPLRILAYTIDTVLLTAALMLTVVVDQYPFVDGWLTVKVLLLVVYVGLGLVALRAERPGRRLAFLIAALAVYGFIVSVALAHDPAGLFAAWT